MADTAAILLWEVLANRRPADRVLAFHLRGHREFGSRDRRLLSELGYAIFRWWGWLRPLTPATFLAALDAEAGFKPFDPAAPPRELPLDILRGIRIPDWMPLLLATAVTETLEDETGALQFWAEACGVQHLPEEAADTAEARALHITRELGFRTAGPPELEALIPDWAPAEIAAPRPLAELIAWFQRRPPLWLRLQNGDPAAVLAELAAAELRPERSAALPDAVRTGNTRINLYLLPAYREGRVEIQDLASQAVGDVCAPVPGERWWDACAGAGGKTLLLARRMQGKGTVVASDVRAFKLEDVRLRARRAGLFNITSRPWDGRPLPVRKAVYDGVLVDAPCSCSGTWRRNPAARWSLDPQEAAAFPELQLGILTAAASAVKPGGVLVYATCSLFTRENEGVVAAFLRNHPEFSLEPVRHPLTGAATDGQVMTWPWDGDCDVLFAARLRRRPL